MANRSSFEAQKACTFLAWPVTQWWQQRWRAVGGASGVVAAISATAEQCGLLVVAIGSSGCSTLHADGMGATDVAKLAAHHTPEGIQCWLG
jgi:hypothetical protein